MIKEYPETHQHGLIEVTEPLIPRIGNNRIGDFGIQIAEDGRIWICIEGQTVIRFKPIDPTYDIHDGHLESETL